MSGSATKTVAAPSIAVTTQLAILVCFLISLAMLPAFVSSYWKDVIIIFLLNCLMVVSYRLITLMGGWSFAHVATMGLGGYSVALLSQAPYNLSIGTTIAIGGFIALIFGLLISYPVLRTREYYFFLATFAAGEALRQCFIQFREITGGTSGIAFIKRPQGFEDVTSFHFLLLAVLAVVVLALLAFERSRVGKTVQAVGRNEELSVSLGINAWGFRSLVFVVGSALAGIAGGFMASYNGIVSPADFSSTLMFKIVASAIVGGVSSYIGPIAGLIFLTGIEQLFRGVPQVVPLVWGICVIFVLLVAPGGIDSRIQSLLSRLRPNKEAVNA
ncbi:MULTISPECIES: branched-chain amino acid ABC transporter permease [Rhizobium/Agrobacterium group]|uniref:branched-chain amino acid ABC transporter permease n=1 Tax=Rhizobium/Agrobacterium group TaxID=227290 RepID=UPI000FDAA6EB|nr:MULTISPECIES: branched-chain amino acid ABC transporter permease [Rhizobium/Agrobacterium group]RVT69634.1 branched-chain amino acid ABC transporter permease [Agrobacterium sp. CNPSo 2736]WHO77291.1 branched-chain amino acid ABC transporter permease [Rhizobium sp. BT03]